MRCLRKSSLRNVCLVVTKGYWMNPEVQKLPMRDGAEVKKLSLELLYGGRVDEILDKVC